MANPLPNEKELYEQIKKEGISINPDIWDLLYNRIGDDISAINLLCRYYFDNKQPIPIQEARKILAYTHHIKDIINKVTVVSKSNLPFPEFTGDMPLHPVLREMFTHYIGNDVYLVNLIVGEAVDPEFPQDLSLEAAGKILNHTATIKRFMDSLREATSERKINAIPEEKDSVSQPQAGRKVFTKEEIFFLISKALAEEFGIKDIKKIKPESRFAEDLGLDSVDAIRVIMILEENFGFEIPDADAERALTIKDAVEYIYKRLKENKKA